MLKSAVFLLYFLSWLNFAKAQSNEVTRLETLKKQLSLRLPDTSKFALLQKISNTYLQLPNNVGLDSAQRYHVKASKLLKNLKNPPLPLQIDELYLHARIERYHKNIEVAIKLLKEAIQLEQINGNLNNQAKLWAEVGFSTFWEENRQYYLEALTASFKKANAIYIETGNLNKQVEMQYWLACLEQGKGNYAACDIACFKILSIPHSATPPFFADVYTLLSSTERYRGNFNKSLRYSLKAFSIMKQTGDSSSATKVFGELAQIYQELGQTQNSIFWYRKTLEIREKKNMKQRFLFRTAGFLANELILENRAEEALREIRDLERRNKPETHFDEATVSQIKAYCYEAMGNAKLAEYHYLKMLRLFDEPMVDEFIVLGKFDIASFYVNQGRYKEAEPFMSSIQGKEVLVSKKKDIELLAFKVDSAAGRYLSAIRHVRKYEQLKDSIFSTAKSKQIEELQIQYQTANNKQAIKLLKKDGLLNLAKVRDANNLRNMTLLVIAVLILFLALLYFSYRAKQRINIEMNKKNIWLNQLVDEKEWLIKEVHHRVKNNLQIVMGLLQRQSAYIDNEKALAAIQNSEHRMQSIALIHQKLYQSESMALINMPEYINELVTYLKESFVTGSRIHFQNEIENLSLDVQHAVPLGLILNEAITNAMKYAFPEQKPGKIYIELVTLDEDYLLLQIKDNGEGLPPDFNLKKVNSLGMNLMRGLSKQLGGKLEVDQASGVIVRVLFKKSKLLSPKREKESHA